MADHPSKVSDQERTGNESLSAKDDLPTSSTLGEEGGEATKRQEKVSSNVSESGSQTSDLSSPTLNPAQANAMNSSVISNLDLGEEPAFPTSSSFGNTLDKIDTTSANQIQQESRGNGPSSAVSPDDLGRTYDGSASTSSFTNSRNSNGYAPLAPGDLLPSAPGPQPSSSSLNSSQSTLSIPNSNSFSSQRTLGPDNSLFNEGDQSGYSGAGTGVAGGAAQSGDDSALNALMEAHSKEPSSPHRPSKRDASFGLDPDVDTVHSLEGQPFRPNILSSPLRPSTSSSGRHRHHDTHHNHSHDKDKGVYDEPEEQEFSHTSAATGAPRTMETGMENVQTVPTVSATGMPRFLPRRTSRSPSNDSINEKRRSSLRRRSSSASSSQVSAPAEMQPQYAPSGSLTIALFTPGLTWRRRSYLLLASMVVNIGLPFINGIALGFGEILARGLIAPWIGLAPAALNINAPAAQRPGVSTTSGVGLRHAGVASASAPPADKGRDDARG
ncbi:uncharacterized protein FA14DRAFT_161056 [Meira miltonrushii]|uniref:TOM13-domain-containing protein n=1 Tax=Meira miltonrushii TaxID=1280837 RepID=A0A316VFF8_9BASI|nr:uncharacterized protein FA14DRAFT_161056 [Meira miltonrushii]PWN36270.1 hypothetical protein FA14DRAFT_161056 [Meira miltonrushii]